MKRKDKLLVVDDSEFSLKFIRNTLQDHYDMICTKEPVKVINIAKKEKPDLILLDIVMPSMNGFDLCRKLQNDPSTSAIPVIFLTTKNNEADVVEGFKVGAVDFITKPFITSELFERIKTHIRLKKLEANLVQKNNTLVELNQKKNEFIGIAAHDLRNPLQAIIGYSELLEFDFGEDASEEQRDYLFNIRRSGEFMLNMINELLDVSLIESGNIKLNRKNGNMKEQITHNIEINRRFAEKKNINIFLKISEDFPESVYYDKEKFEQIINNLISNAVKYSYPDSFVSVSLGIDHNNIILSVKDAGQGIAKSEQEKIFNYFTKASSKATGGEKSTGLGLAITKKIVEEHGGDISLLSIFGKGSTFTVTMPASKSK